MESQLTNCPKCGGILDRIPPKGEWGKQVISQKTGNKYYPFKKCQSCDWSESSDPKPRTWAKKPQNRANLANNSTNSDAFKDELRNMLGDLQAEIMAIGLDVKELLKK